jgi:hypothetical protein
MLRHPYPFYHVTLDHGGLGGLAIVPQRHFLCQHYDACLNDAAAADWKSWDCTRCVAYQCISGERQYLDMYALLTLLGEVFHPENRKPHRADRRSE